jgi:hypothetical protein
MLPSPHLQLSDFYLAAALVLSILHLHFLFLFNISFFLLNIFPCHSAIKMLFFFSFFSVENHLRSYRIVSTVGEPVVTGSNKLHVLVKEASGVLKNSRNKIYREYLLGNKTI